MVFGIGLQGAGMPSTGSERKVVRCCDCKRELQVFSRRELPDDIARLRAESLGEHIESPTDGLDRNSWIYEGEEARCIPCRERRKKEEIENQKERERPYTPQLDPNRTVESPVECVLESTYEDNKLVKRRLLYRHAKTRVPIYSQPLAVPSAPAGD